VLDRRTDLIVSGGENVYPAEIESRLAEHPAVDEACVVGLADELFGARPIAFVVARAGRPVDPAELASFCRETLAGYKVPIDFIERTSLPRTASGKLLRRALTIEPGARPGADPLR
jgi:O-succinylbenzoic acid--CoA ligase